MLGSSKSSSQIKSFVLPMAKALKARGVPVWVDQWDIKKETDWDRAIDDALYGCAHFLHISFLGGASPR